MKGRILAYILCISLLLSLLVIPTAAASPVWDGRSSEPYAGGTGTEDDPYLIANGAQLYQLALDGSSSSNTVGLYYKLSEDIDLGNKSFPGIAYFCGTLDGAGFTISNLKISNTANDYSGLVRRGSHCTIRDLTISGDISGKDYVGGIVGCLSDDSIIEHCINYCKISGNYRIGGICGYSTFGSIQSCQNYGAISATGNSVGGICGSAYTSTTIKACYNVGFVNGDAYYAGGICGYSCISTGSNSKNVFISQCANAGAVSGGREVGGILGTAHCHTNIEDCYNCGIVTASTYYAGGIIGFSEEDYYYHNGYVPRYSGYNSVTRSYNCGVLSSSERSCYDPVNDEPNNSYIYYLTDINEGAFHPSDAVGLTSDEMTSVGGFAGFDFTTVWTWDNSGIYNYPILRALGPVLVPCEDGKHEWNEGTVLRAATCTEIGELLVTCTKCAAAQNQELPALGHNMAEGTAIAPTCTENGLTAGGQCSRCDYTVPQEIVPALGHDMVKDPAVPATCIGTGLTEGSHCSRCDHAVLQQVIPALGHDMIDNPAVPATCTEPGLTEGSYCSRCSHAVPQGVIPATGHSYTSETTDPSCTEDGCTTYVCSTCGDTYSDSHVDALGHAWDNGVQTSAPTCTEEGKREYTCLTCGETKEESIAATGHSYADIVTAPTCTAQGYTTHTCTTCGDSYIDAAVAALGHAWNNGVIVKPASCTVNGKMSYTCTACGETKEEVIIATGHNYVDAVTKPTCTETGYTTHTCSNCGDTYKDTYVGATGHAWNNGIEVIKATCTEKGEKVFTCGNCGATRSEEVAPLGHSYEAVVTAPTCTEGGYTTYTCALCGDSYVADETEALGHTWDEGAVTTEPTATEAGVMTYTCTREGCGETKTEEIPALGENPDEPCDGGEDCPSAHFTDISAADWYHEAVDFAVENGLFGGMSASTFEPNTAMTRAMLVTVLWRYAGEPMEGENTFTDVPAGQWYTDAVAWAAHNSIVGGVGDNRFDPNGNITREQMATILYRYASGQDIDTSARADLSGFPDAGNVSSYAEDAMKWAVAEGLVNGSDGKLMPQGNATRAQVATILMRFIENVVK